MVRTGSAKGLSFTTRLKRQKAKAMRLETRANGLLRRLKTLRARLRISTTQNQHLQTRVERLDGALVFADAEAVNAHNTYVKMRNEGK